MDNWIKILRDNAEWHRQEYLKTKDRYNLGQWKAYSRMVRRLIGV